MSCDVRDLVILDPSWLCGSILGYFLSQESLEKARVTGIYSADDVQLVFPEADGPVLLSVRNTYFYVFVFPLLNVLI